MSDDAEREPRSEAGRRAAIICWPRSTRAIELEEAGGDRPGDAPISRGADYLRARDADTARRRVDGGDPRHAALTVVSAPAAHSAARRSRVARAAAALLRGLVALRTPTK